MALTIDNGGHLPLQENAPERWNCDGVACRSRTICLELPKEAKPQTSRAMQYFVMGLRNPQERAELEAMRKRATGGE